MECQKTNKIYKKKLKFRTTWNKKILGGYTFKSLSQSKQFSTHLVFFITTVIFIYFSIIFSSSFSLQFKVQNDS